MIGDTVAHYRHLGHESLPIWHQVRKSLKPPGPNSAERQTHVTFLLNFSDELRRRVPVGGK